MTDEAAPRQRCYRCMRPNSMCLCDSVPSIPTQTAIVVLQHPHERMHPFGTARFVRLGLPNARVHTVLGGVARDMHCPLDVPDDAVLLYPHPDACDLTQLDPSDRPSTLVVLDGTWSHSRLLYRVNPWLRRLRHVRISPAAPSRYRIRKEPEAHCLSTLEAVVFALRAIEPDGPDLEPLLQAFDQMIDRQIEHTSTNERRVRRRVPRRRESRRTPPLLSDPRLVILYAEATLPGGAGGTDREVVQVTAARRDGGPGIEIFLRPSGALSTDSHLGHMELTRELLDSGTTPAVAQRRLRAFLGCDPVAAWTQSSLDWCADLLSPTTPRFVLKTGYCNLRNRGSGRLDALVAREGLLAPVVECHGRARTRLANAIATAAWMQRYEAALCS